MRAASYTDAPPPGWLLSLASFPVPPGGQCPCPFDCTAFPAGSPCLVGPNTPTKECDSPPDTQSMQGGAHTWKTGN